MKQGQSLKAIRRFRGMTQKCLGQQLGFNEKNAGVRVGQYESIRCPNKDLRERIGQILDVNPDIFVGDTDEVLRGFFSCCLLAEEPADETGDEFFQRLQDFNSQWQKKKDQLASGDITRGEYLEWKLHWSEEPKEYEREAESE